MTNRFTDMSVETRTSGGNQIQASRSFWKNNIVDTNHLCQRREETWVIIRQRGTSEGKVLRCGKSAGLDIQIVENLQVIRDKSSRTYNHPFDPLRGKLLQDL